MRTIESQTCIKFEEISRSWSYFTRHLYIHSGTGCWSYTGRKWWMLSQKVSLSKDGCLYTATVQHELLHALGFTHEHSRSDRDNHVTIRHENIEPNRKYNFIKQQTDNLDTPYDFDSVMQYHNYDFSINKKPTLQSKRNPRMRFGYASGVSKNDILRVNRYYEC
ncbi:hypothetical protein NL108_015416 [Boleophthalmus pectinirostris]|nr:hypothetical protein NL108_015416 [Boleophthalmus pectinirostris]